jgi:predicted MPP superfamily phosphohydrolase
MKLSRRKWLIRSVFLGAPAAGLGYGGVEKQWLSVTRTDVPLHPDHHALAGLNLAVMGDFHHDDFGDDRLVRRAVEAVNAEGIDLVFLVGDYISDDPSAIEPLCEELRNLRPRLGVFGVWGNHDRRHASPILGRTLSRAGVRMLVNGAEEFPGFCVAGMDSHRGGRPRLAEAIGPLPPGKPVLLAWHEPDTFDLHRDPRIALQVSGHTHGGQIRAPVVGPILLPEYGRKYPYGLYRRGAARLFVTRGIGTLTIPARFLCAPEVAILRLKA